MPSSELSRQISGQTMELIEQAIIDHRLPVDFSAVVGRYYLPLSMQLSRAVLNGKSKPSLIGVQGSQGSGKTTCAEFLKILLESEYSLVAKVLSIDDFYLTKKERQVLADTVHPLFTTRGVPGTHDTRLLKKVLKGIAQRAPVRLPSFSKAVDDQLPEDQWVTLDTSVDVVLLEGWCVGLDPQPEQALSQPVNQLEQIEDEQGIWREYVNAQLAGPYREIFKRFDFQIVLQAPSFQCVYGWRLKQENKLISKLKDQGSAVGDTMNPAQIERFISHYQRLTEHALATMPEKADWLLRLNEAHGFEHLVSSRRVR